jgi:LEA14-like dessication related protein
VVGCASWFVQGEPPEVLVTNITPSEGTAFEQRLQVDLRIRNPNDFDLLLTGIDFTLNLNGKRLASGLGNTTITVPRLSDAVVSVQTSTSTLDVVRQLLSFSQTQDLSYDITGRLHLKDGHLPFDTSGILLEKGQLSGAPSP